MDTSRGPGRAGLARLLMILGAFLSVCALHSLTSAQDPPVVSSGTTHAAVEKLEQVVMAAPVVLASDSSSHHHTLPCAATLAGSMLLLSAWLILRRQRFGDTPRCATVPQATQPPCLRDKAAPQLAQLCILRT